MKIPVWYLVVLLACLFTPGRSDCQGGCVACGLLVQQQLQQAFDTMVSALIPHVEKNTCRGFINVCVCMCVFLSLLHIEF